MNFFSDKYCLFLNSEIFDFIIYVLALYNLFYTQKGLKQFILEHSKTIS